MFFAKKGPSFRQTTQNIKTDVQVRRGKVRRRSAENCNEVANPAFEHWQLANTLIRYSLLLPIYPEPNNQNGIITASLQESLPFAHRSSRDIEDGRCNLS
jgi:hypothetical protein